jgi:ribosomal protein L40E
MADYLAMDGSGGNVYPNTEHYLRRVLAGNVADVRRRLNDVLERLDYDFIDEGEYEIEARRGARGWAGAYASADVLDYPRSLVIKLKPLSETSTRASFAYIIKHPSLNRGEKEVLTREAETIATLATIRATDKICRVCGAEASDDSRFCRKCGAPMTGDETAIEVLRMTAEIRSGHTSVVSSAVVGTIITLVTLGILILLATGASAVSVKWLLLLSVVFGLINVALIGFGWKRLNNALKSDKPPQPVISGSGTQSLNARDASALPPAPASFSVTDGTTRSLNYPEKTPVLENRETKTTSDLN